jgi:hypothetical protein
MPATPVEPNPSIVARKVGAGIQARLAKLQGAAGTPVVTREPPKKFPNGYGQSSLVFIYSRLFSIRTSLLTWPVLQMILLRNA